MNIFLDLDETLWHTKTTMDIDKMIEYADGKYITNSYVEGFWKYVSFLRPEARIIIDTCEQFVGEGNVKVLTTATRDYAKHFIEKFEFPFNFDNLYTREDIQGHPGVLEEFEHDHNVLIDNETYYYHTLGNKNKVRFLGDLPIENYYNIEEFMPMFETGFGDPGVDIGELSGFLKERSEVDTIKS